MLSVYQVIAPGNNMGTGHHSKFCQLLNAAESHKVLQHILIGVTLYFTNICNKATTVADALEESPMDEQDLVTNAGPISAMAASKPVEYPYPISSFLAYTPGVNEWKATLERICNLGGNKVLQYGPTPKRMSETEIRAHDVFKNCEINGNHCIDHIRDKLKILSNNNELRNR